jgi:hypothetical protein
MFQFNTYLLKVILKLFISLAKLVKWMSIPPSLTTVRWDVIASSRSSILPACVLIARQDRICELSEEHGTTQFANRKELECFTVGCDRLFEILYLAQPLIARTKHTDEVDQANRMTPVTERTENNKKIYLHPP